MTMESIEQNMEVIYEFVEERPEDIREQLETLFDIRI